MLTAEQHNDTRRAVKARQQNRKKSPKHQPQQTFSIQQTQKERAKRERFLQCEAERNLSTATAMLNDLGQCPKIEYVRPLDWFSHEYNGPGSEYAETGKWKHYIELEDVEQMIRRWYRICNKLCELIESGTAGQYRYNHNWRKIGRLIVKHCVR